MPQGYVFTVSGGTDLFAESSTILVTENTFQHNYANSGTGGGALYINNNNNITIMKNIFQDNTAGSIDKDYSTEGTGT
jgi:hypothetical protein